MFDLSPRFNDKVHYCSVIFGNFFSFFWGGGGGGAWIRFEAIIKRRIVAGPEEARGSWHFVTFHNIRRLSHIYIKQIRTDPGFPSFPN